MTYRTRSPYAVFSRPSREGDRPYRLPGREVREAVADWGPTAIAIILRDNLRPLVTGRVSTPEEVRLCRDWLDVEVADGVAYWTARLTGGTPEDAPDVAPARLSEEVEEPEEAVSAAVLACVSCGSLFGRPAVSRGRPRTRCYTCSPPR